MKNSKKLPADELWDLLAQTGAIPSKDKYLQEEKKVVLTCKEVDRLIKDDQAIFDSMATFSHILSCDNCRTKYRKRREDQ